jgi:hypothetical protein
VLATGAVFSVAREGSLSLGNSGGSGGRRGLGEGRGSSKGRRGLVARLVGVARREVERGEGRGMRRVAGGAQCGVDAHRCRRGVGRVRAAAAVVAGVRRQRSDYGQAVGTGSLCARQGAGVLWAGRRVLAGLEGARALLAAIN